MKREAKRIFIVDQDPAYQEELSRLFVQQGYEVETSDYLTPALGRMKERKFDCIIINADLPELKAYEAVPIIKTVDQKIIVIMTVDMNTLELESNVRKQDVFYYHIKSFGTEELNLAVHGALKQ